MNLDIISNVVFGVVKYIIISLFFYSYFFGKETFGNLEGTQDRLIR
jgi:hypothetical protein